MKVLANSSVDMGMGFWNTNPKFTNVWLYALQDNDGTRYLWFSSPDPSLSAIIRSTADETTVEEVSSAMGIEAIPESEILSVTKATKIWGPNLPVDVLTTDERVCISGPRGRMKTIFAALGHPL